MNKRDLSIESVAISTETRLEPGDACWATIRDRGALEARTLKSATPDPVDSEGRRSRYGPRSIFSLSLATLMLLGAGAKRRTPPPTDQDEIEAAASVLLEMRPDANWTQAYNRLLDFGPRSIEYVVNRPEMRRRAAPGDLRVALGTSLVRMLARPGKRPRLTINCFETSLNILYFDPKVGGRRLGTVVITAGRVPAAWHELYPADFDHALAARVDVEADRRAVRRWWRKNRGSRTSLANTVRLRPVESWLWPVLSRRYADVWMYEPDAEAVVLCASPQPPDVALLREASSDYNLVRAACIWLAGSETPGVQRDLIERVADPSPIVSHNARFALERCSDARIREVIKRYNDSAGSPNQSSDRRSVSAARQGRAGRRLSPIISVSCEQHGGVAHEMVQVCARVRDSGRTGHVYRGAFRRH